MNQFAVVRKRSAASIAFQSNNNNNDNNNNNNNVHPIDTSSTSSSRITRLPTQASNTVTKSSSPMRLKKAASALVNYSPSSLSRRGPAISICRNNNDNYRIYSNAEGDEQDEDQDEQQQQQEGPLSMRGRASIHEASLTSVVDNRSSGKIMKDTKKINVVVRLRPLQEDEENVPVQNNRWKHRKAVVLEDPRAWSIYEEQQQIQDPPRNTDHADLNTSRDSSIKNSTTSDQPQSQPTVLVQKGATRKVPGRTVFSVDRIFDEESTNVHVYSQVAKPLVLEVLEGRHGTVFAYGQTGSGKTFTMQGGVVPVIATTNASRIVSREVGIVQLAATDLFAQIDDQRDERDFTIRVQYFEIYNEQVLDLLVPDCNSAGTSPTKTTASSDAKCTKKTPRDAASCAAKSHKSSAAISLRSGDGFAIVPAHEVTVHDVLDVVSLLDKGNRARTVGATELNAHSSRSHAIFRILVDSKSLDDDDSGIRSSVLNFVDLAGSENSSAAGTTGIRKRESGNINQSLLTLSRVIHALSLPPRKRPKYIAYRDSKLTRILQPHLSGNACLAVLCCVSASRLHLEETRSTLKFAMNAKRIQVKPTVNEIVDHRTLLIKLQKELAETKEELARLKSRERVLSPDDLSSESTQEPSSEVSTEEEQQITPAQPLNDILLAQGKVPAPPQHGSLPAEVVVIADTSHGQSDAFSVDERLKDSQRRAEFLKDRLDRAEDLIESLFRQIRALQGFNVEEEVDDLDRLKETLEWDFTKRETTSEETKLLLEQCLLLKYSILLGLCLFVMGQSELFLAVVMFLWLTLEVVTE